VSTKTWNAISCTNFLHKLLTCAFSFVKTNCKFFRSKWLIRGIIVWSNVPFHLLPAKEIAIFSQTVSYLTADDDRSEPGMPSAGTSCNTIRWQNTDTWRRKRRYIKKWRRKKIDNRMLIKCWAPSARNTNGYNYTSKFHISSLFFLRETLHFSCI